MSETNRAPVADGNRPASDDAERLDIESLYSEVRADTVDEADRLRLARQLLLFLGVLTVGIFIAYASYPENPALEAIFELFKIGVLPLITLIVSFYFSRTDQ